MVDLKKEGAKLTSPAVLLDSLTCLGSSFGWTGAGLRFSGLAATAERDRALVALLSSAAKRALRFCRLPWRKGSPERRKLVFLEPGAVGA